ncbi:hypothetical protein [Paenibacillus sp. Y412MC10]|nr:hypothetical protein [Paenibacillus sp. Y412MC10]
MEGALQLIDNLVDLETSIEACINQKEDIFKQQRERKEKLTAGQAEK